MPEPESRPARSLPLRARSSSPGSGRAQAFPHADVSPAAESARPGQGLSLKDRIMTRKKKTEVEEIVTAYKGFKQT